MEARTKRSPEEQELIDIFAEHFPDVPLTPEVEDEWLAHVKACGGCNTALGAPTTPEEEAARDF